MNFSIVIIARNESKNLPILAETLQDFLAFGGEVCLLDTGSTDDTINVAQNLGFKTSISETKFHLVVTKKEFLKWKNKNKISSPVLKHFPAQYFAFDCARNYASSVASNDIIFFIDGCDHFVHFDFQKINSLIQEGYENFITTQLYNGVKGGINRFYHRKKGTWIGHCHEYIRLDNVKQMILPDEVVTIKHVPAVKERKYMAGLIATHLEREDGRWNFYLGRELYFSGFYEDAKILLYKSFENHYQPEERAAAMCLIAKCEKNIQKVSATNEPISLKYRESLNLNTTLKEPLFELAEYHKNKNEWAKVLEYSLKCLHLIKNVVPMYFEEERFSVEEHLYGYLYLSYYNLGQFDLASYYFKKFCDFFKIIPERHEHWKFFSKYMRGVRRSIPHVIGSFTHDISDVINENVNYKHITTIDEFNKNPVLKVSSDSSSKTFINFIRKYIPPYSNAIIVGAGKGYNAIDISNLIYPGTLYAFEPDIELFQELNANCYVNSCFNVKTYNSLDILYGNKIDDYNNISLIHISSTNFVEILENAFSVVKNNKPFIALTIENSNKKIIIDGEFEKQLISIGYNALSLVSSLYFIPNHFYKARIAIVCYTNLTWDDSITFFKNDGINGYVRNEPSVREDNCPFGEAEVAVINLAKALSDSGYIVDVWCKPNNADKLFSPIKNLRFLDYANFHNAFETSKYYNSIVWWRYPSEVKKKSGIKNILWLHDIVGDVNIENVDSIVFLSESQREKVIEINKDEKLVEKSYVIPNGFPLLETISKRIKFRCVYLNNPSYGLELVLHVWPAIKEKIPEATLHVYHDIQTWGLFTVENENVLKERIKNMENLGVCLIGTLNQNDLNEELSKAEFWLYPCAVLQSFCIQGVQACTLGVIPIVYKDPFLCELTPEECWNSDFNYDTFSRKCIEIMNLSEDELEKLRAKVIEKAKLIGKPLPEIAKEFSKLF